MRKEGDKMTAERAYTSREVSELLAVNVQTVRVWLRTGQLRGININGRWRVKESELQKFMDSREK